MAKFGTGAKILGGIGILGLIGAGIAALVGGKKDKPEEIEAPYEIEGEVCDSTSEYEEN